MPSPWLAVGAETDLRTRARELQRSWERLLGEGALGAELPPEATAGLRPTILESWQRSLDTGLDPTKLMAPIDADPSEVRERWLEHPLGSVKPALAARLGELAEASRSLVVVTDASGLLLHIDGAEWLKERAREMNLFEGARFSEAVDGTNGIGTALAADHAFQVFAFEHFNQLHHQWVCSGVPVHDPVSGQIVGLIDLSSLWKIAHPRSLELVTTAARTMERCVLDARRDRDARLRRRYGDLMTRSADLLVDRDGYVLEGDRPRRPTPIDVPEGGGEIILADGAVAVAEPLGQGEAYLLRRPGSRTAKRARVGALERAEVRARELATEQAALRQVATLVARESSPDRLFGVVANQAARIFNVPLVKLIRYEQDGATVVGGFVERSYDPFPTGSRWPLDSPSLIASIRHSGRPARVQDYAHMPGEVAAAVRGSGMRSAVGSPIVVEGRLWGGIVIASPQREPLPEDTEARLTDFTELVATAIANAESRAAANRLADEQAALRRVATMVARRVSPDELFSAVTNEVGQLVGTEAAIARFEPDGSAMVVVGVTPGIPVVTIGTRWQLEDFLASAAVYRTGRPARNDHTGHRDASGTVADSLRQMDFTSTVAVPIIVDGRTWGVMTVSDKRRPLPSGTEERVERFTDLVATAIANADSRWALGRLVEEQAALRRVATLVARAPASEELFSTVAREVASVLDVSGVIVTRYEADGTAVTLGEAFGPDLAGAERFLGVGIQTPPDPGSLAAQVHDTHGPARIDDFSTLPGTVGDLARAAGVGSGCAGPIVVNGALWGNMCVFSRVGTVLPAGMENRLQDFIELIATAIANYEARAHLAASEAHARELADEQAALGRVATLVAEGASPDEVFSVVSNEVGRLFGSDQAAVARYDPDGSGMVYVGVSQGARGISIGTRWALEDFLASTTVYRTGRPARMDRSDIETASGPLADMLREIPLVSRVAAPVVVEGALWGVITVSGMHERLPPATEERVAKFTELVATAIANAESRAELAASEARAHELAKEQAALRRVATLVAKDAKPDEVFSAVSQEVEDLLGIEIVTICRHESDGFLLLSSRGLPGFRAGMRLPLDVPSLPAFIYRAGAPVRIDDFTNAEGLNAAARDAGVRSAVGVPIAVGGTAWGSMCAASTMSEPFPADTEERLARFTDLVATSVSNAIMREELADSETRAQDLAREQAALRRVATLVARGVSSDELFSAVSNEVGQLFGSDQTAVGRYEPDGSGMVLVGLSQGLLGTVPIGTRWPLEDFLVATTVYRTGRPARQPQRGYETSSSSVADTLRELDIVSRLGAPIVVEGNLWGVIMVSDRREPIPVDAEEQVAKFTELVATAIANADSREELAASRARIIAAADDARRRIERDLHDGAQQRLVTLMARLRTIEATMTTEPDGLRADVSAVAEGLAAAVHELRELSRGIHPAVLTEGGLAPALKALKRRSAIRVTLDVDLEQRLPSQVETAAYYTVAEALTNAAKHANATRVWVSLRVEHDRLLLSIRDDGVGDADPNRGSGLTGLKDRIEALGGELRIESPPGRGTGIEVQIPIPRSFDGHAEPETPAQPV